MYVRVDVFEGFVMTVKSSQWLVLILKPEVSCYRATEQAKVAEESLNDSVKCASSLCVTHFCSLVAAEMLKVSCKEVTVRFRVGRIRSIDEYCHAAP